MLEKQSWSVYCFPGRRYLFLQFGGVDLTPEMQTLRYKFGVASVSTLLGTALLLVQLCGAICAFSSGRTVGTASSSEQGSQSGHCHQRRQAQFGAEPQVPQSPKNHPHKCADHETAVMLPIKNSLATAVVSFHFTPLEFEPFTLPSFYRSVAVSIGRWDSRRAPPRVPQRSVLRI